MTSLGQKIRAARDESGLSRKDLAEIVGVGAKTIQRYENNKTSPNVDGLVAIADALETPFEYFVEEYLTAKLANSERSFLANVPPDERLELTIYQHVRPAAGEGNIIYEVDANESETHIQSKRLFKDLLGFWPPGDMRGAYIDGESMKPGLDDGQLVLYQPVEELVNGKRYLLLSEDPITGDWKLVLKRVQVFTGGGIKLISDNRGLGIEDEILVPNGDDGLVHRQTEQKVQLRVVGRVLWPREDDEARQIQLITRTIERMASMGYELPKVS